jgi:hypothetical protein
MFKRKIKGAPLRLAKTLDAHCPLVLYSIFIKLCEHIHLYSKFPKKKKILELLTSWGFGTTWNGSVQDAQLAEKFLHSIPSSGIPKERA